MARLHPLLLNAILALLIAACGIATSQAASDPTATESIVSPTSANACPVTRPQEPAFVPPSPYSPSPTAGYFWYGDAALWTAIPGNGEWADLPRNPEGYTQKVFWWRDGYSWTEEQPQLSVTGRRLDGEAPPLVVSRATNAYADDIGSAMLVGVDFPTLGCWEITGRYDEAELSFVVWVDLK